MNPKIGKNIKKLFCLLFIGVILFGLSSSIVSAVNGGIIIDDSRYDIVKDIDYVKDAVIFTCACTVGEKKDCTVPSGDAKGCKGKQTCITGKCPAYSDINTGKTYNGVWGTCVAVEHKCDEDCDGTPETCKSTSQPCKSCACTPVGDKRECDTSEGCAGEQECTISGWSECQSSLSFCDTNCDNTPDTCMESCPEFECIEGQIKVCNASGCSGIQNCTDCSWSTCVSEFLKCDINFDGTSDKCMEPPCPECTDNNCAGNEHCVNNTCAPLNCSAGQQAQNHQCIAVAGYCTSNDNCTGSESCVNNACAPLNCSAVEQAENHQCQKIPGGIPIGLIIGIIVIIIIIVLLIFLWIRPSKLDLVANPTDIPADGKSVSTITITIKNIFGKALGAKKDIPVTVSASSGKIADKATISKGGTSATAVLTSSRNPEVAEISASAENLSGSASVTFRATAKRFCMHCGAQMISETDSCPRCKKLPPSGVDTKNCPNCNAVVPSIAKFCRVCGAGQPT